VSFGVALARFRNTIGAMAGKRLAGPCAVG